MATAPWALLRTDPERARGVLRAALGVLRVIAGELRPFVPRAAAALRARLDEGGAGAPLFPRLLPAASTK